MPEIAITPLDVPTRSATDLVFQKLYEAVISLQLPPGTKVSETEVARQLEVSRQPVRDAFFRLSNLGFLLIRPQRATLITRISEQAVRDAMFVRLAIEVECLRVAIARLSEDDIHRIQANLDDQKEALDQTNLTAFYAADDRFHALLCDIAGRPRAWTLIQSQKAHMDRVRYLNLTEGRRVKVMAEHDAVFEAIRTGNAALAETRLRAHISDIGSILADQRQRFPDYFEPQG